MQAFRSEDLQDIVWKSYECRFQFLPVIQD